MRSPVQMYPPSYTVVVIRQAVCSGPSAAPDCLPWVCPNGTTLLGSLSVEERSWTAPPAIWMATGVTQECSQPQNWAEEWLFLEWSISDLSRTAAPLAV